MSLFSIPCIGSSLGIYHHFPKHCMICNDSETHSTLYCPYDDMRFVLLCQRWTPFHKLSVKGFVPPGRWSWKATSPSWSSASTSEDYSDDSTDTNGDKWFDRKDQGWYAPPDPPEAPNPPCPPPPPPVSIYSAGASTSNTMSIK